VKVKVKAMGARPSLCYYHHHHLLLFVLLPVLR
jgi:hypothetical protein